jgi:hypothetical protein
VLRPRQQSKLARGTKDEEHAMSPKLNSEIAVIGIDIGKNSFHVVGLDRRGAIVLRQKWSRGQVEARLSNLPRCARRKSTQAAPKAPQRKRPCRSSALSLILTVRSLNSRTRAPTGARSVSSPPEAFKPIQRQLGMFWMAKISL